MLGGMGRDEMRAGDADRQQVAERLRQALDEGRLDLLEYDERLQRAYAAKTYGDLNGLLDDLPTVSPVLPALAAPEAAADPYHHATRRWLWNTWEEYLGVVGLVIGIWAVICVAAQDLVYFWPIWVAGPWGVVLIGQTVSGLGKGEPRRWVDDEERKRQEKAAKKQRKAELKARKAAAAAGGDQAGLPDEAAADQAAARDGAAQDRSTLPGQVALPREPAQPAVTADSLFADPVLSTDAVADPGRRQADRQRERQPRKAD